MRYIDWPEVFIYFLGIVLFFVVLFAVLAIPAAIKEENRLMAECMKEHKEYECVAMLRSHDNTTMVMPMPIVVR